MTRKQTLVIALLLLVLLTCACKDAPGFTDTWFIVPCPGDQRTIFEDGARHCEPMP